MNDDVMDRDDAPEIEETFDAASVVERFGKYRSLGRIGQGGMADVFLAVGRGPAGFNKLVVIKRLRENVASDKTFCDMFLDEARLAARLNHPNIVQTYEVFEHEGAFFITMEYLEGQPLNRIARDCRRRAVRLQPQIHARIMSDVLSGLNYAHSARDFDGTPLQIVHRDVSPQNIFVTYNGQVKVVDFGIAKAERSNAKTQAGFFKGKAAYMAPEQLDGRVIDRRVDVFTAGIVLWELLVGKRLMAAQSTAQTLVRLLHETVPRVSASVPDIDPKLDAIVSRALERDPDQRYQTAGEMHDALEQYLLEGHHSVRYEEMGRIVSEAFRDARTELQREIRAQMAHASEFPRTQSGTMSIAGPLLGPASADPTSMSGISTNHTMNSSFTPMHGAPSGTTGLIIAERSSRNVWITSALVAAIAAVSVAVIFTLAERVRTVAAPDPLPPVPAALAPVVTHPDPPPTAEPTDQDRAREPVHAEPAAPAPAARPVQPPSVWRPARPAEPRPAPQRTAAPSAPAPVSAPSTVVASTTATAESNPVRPPPPPSAAPTPTPTQEGRRFRTSL